MDNNPTADDRPHATIHYEMLDPYGYGEWVPVTHLTDDEQDLTDTRADLDKWVAEGTVRNIVVDRHPAPTNR